MKYHYLVAVIIINFLAFRSVQAQNDEENLLDLSISELMNITVTTASRHAESTTDAPGTVLVVTQQQIRERGYVNLYQLLEDLPGVDVQNYANNIELNRVSIRGFVRNDKFVVMQDGIRINSPTGETVPISDNFSLYNAKQVEIVYGPASALYGADAFTGVINIITTQASDIEGVEFTALGGEFGSHALYAHAGTQINDTLQLSGGAHWQETDNPDLADYYPQDFALGDLVTLNGETVTKAQDRQGYIGDTRSSSAYFKAVLNNSLTLGGNYWAFRSRTDVAARPETTDYGSAAYWNSALMDVYANYRFTLNPQLKGFAQFDYADYEVAPQSYFANIYTNFANGYKYVHGTKKQLETQLEYAWNDNNNLIGGISLADYFSQPKTIDLPTRYNTKLAPQAQNFSYLGTENTLPVNIYQHNYRNIGAYLQWRRTWNAQWASIMGMRYDHNSSYGTSFNPRFGLIYQPQETTTLKVLYGTAFLAPSPFLAYEHYGSFSGQTNDQGLYLSDFLHIPNPNLKPEEIQTLEFNVTHHLNDHVSLLSSVYYSQADNLIYNAPADPQQPTYIPGGLIAYTQYNDNIGQAKSYGGDLSLNYLYYFKHGASLKVWSNYSYANGKLEHEGQEYAKALPNVAKHKLKLGLTYTHGAFTLSPKLLWIGNTASAQTATTNPSQTLHADSYMRLDLHAQWQVQNNLNFLITIWNVLDQRYYQTTDEISTSFVAIPQDPRRFYAGLRYQFH